MFSVEDFTCDHVTGEFKCRPGYTGPECLYSCPYNTYGKNCANSCNCSVFSDCHHETGKIIDNKNYNQSSNSRREITRQISKMNYHSVI